MRQTICLLAGVAAVGMLALPAARGQSNAAKHAVEARALVKSFTARLEKELATALNSGDAKQAVSVCKVAAPAFAAETSETSGWEVARTALKLRNPKNAPDEWERRVLAMFEQRMVWGGDAKTLEHFEIAPRDITRQDGKPVFRYMKAILTAKPCLICHGRAVDPELKAHLAELYPSDKATGFALGDIRGAFTLVRPLQN